MKEVYERLYVGSDIDCRDLQRVASMTIIHGCKTCHSKALGERSVLSTDPRYLSVERDGDLFLNLIDPPVPLFRLESFEKFLRFAGARYAEGESLLVHCNQGHSRAPSLALLLLAKRLGVIGNGSFKIARSDFESIFEGYTPGKGIETFLTQHWQEL